VIATSDSPSPIARTRRHTGRVSSTAPVTTNAIAKWGSVIVPTTPATQNAMTIHVPGDLAASSAATTSTPIARKASP
jgi:hypothetical protein